VHDRIEVIRGSEGSYTVGSALSNTHPTGRKSERNIGLSRRGILELRVYWVRKMIQEKKPVKELKTSKLRGENSA